MQADDTSLPRTWRRLDQEQRELAAEIVRRAMALRLAADGGLSVKESVEIAARQIGRCRDVPAAMEPVAEAVPDGS